MNHVPTTVNRPPAKDGDARAALVRVDGIARRHGTQAVYENVSLTVSPGEFVAVLGESGVGKSTLLNAIAGLDRIDSGRITVDGIDVHALDDDARAAFRRRTLGFVFQAFHVLPQLSVAGNVGLPLLLQGRPDDARVSALLDAVGLAGFEARLPETLSGGQLQRVAIARALVHAPPLLLADEPTGNLDPRTAALVLDLFVRQVREHGAACLLVTHSQAAAARADRVLELTAGGVRTA